MFVTCIVRGSLVCVPLYTLHYLAAPKWSPANFLANPFGRPPGHTSVSGYGVTGWALSPHPVTLCAPTLHKEGRGSSSGCIGAHGVTGWGWVGLGLANAFCALCELKMLYVQLHCSCSFTQNYFQPAMGVYFRFRSCTYTYG